MLIKFYLAVQLTSDPAIAMALKPGDGGLDPSSRALLDKLDELLVGCIPKKVENAHGVDYTVGLDELKKVSARCKSCNDPYLLSNVELVSSPDPPRTIIILYQERLGTRLRESQSRSACASHMNKAERAVAEKASQVLAESQASASSTSEPFRILSIGCGDGTFDAKIIQAMIRKYPDVKIHYIGIDIDKGVCDRAKEEVGALKANREVEIKMIAMDFEDIDSIKAEIPPTDLVLAVHAFYYMKDLRKAITDAQVLTKADHGRMFILLTNPNSPKTQLFHRFYLHEHGWPQKFSNVAMETLDSLGIEYTIESIDGELDFTECFRDRFQKPHQRFLLDFMTHTKTERYPAEISQLCIEFLSSAAIGKPDHYIIPFSVAFIVSKNKL